MPGKSPSHEVQGKCIEEILETIKIASESDGKEVVVFFDPMHQTHNNENDYCWQARGRSETQNVLANTGRRRLNIMGAMNPISLIPTILLSEANCDQETLKIFLNELKGEYPLCTTIHCFLDNASYNRAYSVQDYAQTRGIMLHYLPPYSPNLNLIERLWKFSKKKLVKNKYYPTFQEFYDATSDFFANIEDHMVELKSLLNLKFQII